jgi:hypothetical protein
VCKCKISIRSGGWLTTIPTFSCEGLAASRPVALLDHPHLEQDLGFSTHTWPAKPRIIDPVWGNCGLSLLVAIREPSQSRCRSIRTSSDLVSSGDFQVFCEALNQLAILTLIDMFKPKQKLQL